ncbi:glycerophosphodiester phosphodiesterase [Nocardioides humi]|uniref:glycerophosphodiester phosphodiesterase n=1 Tax=Nocardioides humi TaxID=449461 RepID=A0ABN1ZR86_9ACTN|nr:glycerophosphodiester phosphodiesterase [Nocardioides humi]
MTSRTSPARRALLILASTAVALGVAAVPAHADRGHGHDHDHGPHPAAAPLVIAHRGASGYRPEHTLAAYRLAIRMGADYVEPDLVSTRDGVLVARHENEISGTTDVAAHPELADRRTTKTIDGVAVTGWFTEDLTLAELKTLRAKERLPEVRPGNTRYDGRFQIPTLEEVVDLVRRESRRRGRVIGIAPETKHPTYFDSIGLSLEEPLVRTLRRHGLDRRNAEVVIQSFESGNLRELARMTRVPLVQLVERPEQVAPAQLADIATYAAWVGPTKDLVLPRDAGGAIGAPSTLVRDAHRAGLKVVTWTMRVENQFLPANHRLGTDPNAKGDLAGEIAAFLDAGVDALFSDNPDIAVAARDRWVRKARRAA